MSDWLNSVLPPEARHAGLAIASLGDERNFGRGGFALTSPAFNRGEGLDPCFTADEEDAVAPPLEWTAPPPSAQELIIIVEDASTKTGTEPACHWLVWGLPSQRGKLLEGELPPRAGKNAHGNSEWLLPEPPQDDPPHYYVFQIFAVDLPLTLMPGADRGELLAQLQGNVVASALTVGHYARQAHDEDAWAQEDVE